jgi:hypothetical protein
MVPMDLTNRSVLVLFIDVLAGVWITTRQLTKCELNSGLASQNINPLASVARFFSISLTLCTICGQLFSDLASENSELLASLANVFEILFTPLVLALCNLYTQHGCTILFECCCIFYYYYY